MPKNQKMLSAKAYKERDRDILMMWSIQGVTMEQIGKIYGISKGRVQQILDRERRRKAIQSIPPMLLDSLYDRLEALYGYLIPEAMKKSISLKAIFMHTLRYLKNRDFVNHSNQKTWPEWVLKCPTENYLCPKTWVEWLKQATDEEILHIRGIGIKKARILMEIRDDIRRRRTERERDLIFGITKLY